MMSMAHKTAIVANLIRVFVIAGALGGMPVFGVAPKLASISPPGAQRGADVELNFKGERLQDADEIICYEPGIQIVKLTVGTNEIAKAQVKIASDSPLGEHHLRVRTA